MIAPVMACSKAVPILKLMYFKEPDLEKKSALKTAVKTLETQVRQNKRCIERRREKRARAKENAT